MASKIIRHIPNAITCCNLLCGSAATLLAFGSRLTGEYQKALLLIVAGAVFDFFDGLTARALHVSGPMGKELDSLADVVTFGLAPSAMVAASRPRDTFAAIGKIALVDALERRKYDIIIPMKFVLYTNSASEHQLPLARAVVRHIGGRNFLYVSCKHW